MEYEDGEKSNRSDEDRLSELENFTSPLVESSQQIHELYMSYRAGGFSPDQAIYLLAVAMNNNPLLPPSGISEDE